MMKNGSQAELISYNRNSMEICASAARISTTKGDAVEIFEKAKENPRNQALIQKVFVSGHKSVIEHAVFTLALKDVSAFTEQFFIECRLASFTVKSRRYVDFSNSGYYIPEDLEGGERKQYCQYMDMLFSAYENLLEGGVPKEDARFLLPYSFHSNFYCTLNARELLQLLSAIRRGRGQGIPELQDLADQIVRQVEEILPGIFSEPGREEPAPAKGVLENSGLADSQSVYKALEVSFVTPQEAGSIRLLNAPSNPLDILNTAYSVNHPGSDSVLDVDALIKSKRPRELEQLTYSFLISHMTLSGITHMVRHRMQSIIIPSICDMDHSHFILPDTIRSDARMAKTYQQAVKQAYAMAKEMYQNPVLRKYGYYYALSGNVMDIMTTVNARELNHFIQLRTCSRAQWEIQKVSVEILRCLRKSCPALFGLFGPSCYVNGFCPEGKMTCGNMRQVVEDFRELRPSN